MKSILPVVAVLLFGVVHMSFAQADLQLGARPQGLGGAYVAVANDANAVYWNAAGLGQIDRGEATVMHWALPELNQIVVDYGALVYPVGRGAVGVSWTRQAATLEEGLQNTQSTLSVNTFMLSYGLPLASFVSGGMSLTRTTLDSPVGNGAGLGLEFGLMLRPLETDHWTIGLTAKNIAANLKNESLTPYYIGGTAYRFGTTDSTHNFLVAVDLNTRQDIEGKEGTTVKYAAGLEYRLSTGDYGFAIRGGTGSKNTSFGFGITYHFLSVDYAFVKMKDDLFGNSHKFGVSFFFDR
ncbi:MAG: hypothetical protein HY033_07490 [Ignavibacteriae bacterium]|nr:hypothetical protein [Ignavibacteria bacterium]MBI3364735.1 hypothetical protein [Ignavibacteriota bacterium]